MSLEEIIKTEYRYVFSLVSQPEASTTSSWTDIPPDKFLAANKHYNQEIIIKRAEKRVYYNCTKEVEDVCKKC